MDGRWSPAVSTLPDKPRTPTLRTCWCFETTPHLRPVTERISTLTKPTATRRAHRHRATHQHTTAPIESRSEIFEIRVQTSGLHSDPEHIFARVSCGQQYLNRKVTVLRHRAGAAPWAWRCRPYR